MAYGIIDHRTATWPEYQLSIRSHHLIVALKKYENTLFVKQM